VAVDALDHVALVACLRVEPGWLPVRPSRHHDQTSEPRITSTNRPTGRTTSIRWLADGCARAGCLVVHPIITLIRSVTAGSTIKGVENDAPMMPVTGKDVMLEKIVKDKVLCYVVRDGRLLVFRHTDYSYEEVGIQVPAGDKGALLGLLFD
jgi:hypothetical protein